MLVFDSVCQKWEQPFCSTDVGFGVPRGNLIFSKPLLFKRLLIWIRWQLNNTRKKGCSNWSQVLSSSTVTIPVRFFVWDLWHDYSKQGCKTSNFIKYLLKELLLTQWGTEVRWEFSTYWSCVFSWLSGKRREGKKKQTKTNFNLVL